MSRPWPPLSAYARFWLRVAILRWLGLTTAGSRIAPASRVGRHPSLGGIWPLGIGAPTEMPDEFERPR